MKSRWIIVGLAVAAAIAFVFAVQGGRWWSIGEVEIGPAGATQCFSGDCRATGLGWIGGSETFVRIGKAAWAGGLIAAFTLLVLAAGVAARRIPRLAAKTAVVAIVTAAAAAIGFVAQFPGLPGVTLDRGVWWFAGAVVVGLAATVAVLRARPATPAA